MATLPPPLPSCILRGHASHVHCVQFVRHNAYLLTGDAQGCVIYWSLATKRAVYVWKAHAGPILGIAQWGYDRIITHGRDNTLRVWQLRPDARTTTHNISLPADSGELDSTLPWLLHSLPVNTLNFCAFAMCHQSRHTSPQDPDPILVAVPGRDDKQIEVWQLPDELLKIIIPRVQAAETGMVMALKLAHHQRSQNMLLLAGYEGGATAAFRLPANCTSPAVGSAELVYLSQPHTQPVLSLDASPDADSYFTSSADARVAMHRIPELTSDISEHHPYPLSQQGDSKEHMVTPDNDQLLSDEASLIKAPPLAPADSPTEESNVDSSEPPISFEKVPAKKLTPHTPKPGGLASLLASSSTTLPCVKPAQPVQPLVTVQPPYKTMDTKHAGQQSLRVRSDGRLIITGGWDARIRIYSSKTLKEVAVLKWHKEGVYAVAFGEIVTAEDLAKQDEESRFMAVLKEAQKQSSLDKDAQNSSLQPLLHKLGILVKAGGEDLTQAIREAKMDASFQLLLEQHKPDGLLEGRIKEREDETKMKHWVAAGSKDGKVSLWEVF